MHRFLALSVALPMVAGGTELIKFESGKAALARDVNENFARLDTATQNRATKDDLASSEASLKASLAAQTDSLRAVSERNRQANLAATDSIKAISARLHRDSVALAQLQTKVRKDSSASASDLKALQTTVAGLGSGGLPASAVSGKANTVAKFTGANAVGNSSLTDDGSTVSTGANLTVSGGSLKLSNASTNQLEFASVGLGLPTFGTRTKGAKAVWFGGLGASSGEYATGVYDNTLWNSVPLANADHMFVWYGGVTPLMTLAGVGTLEVASDIRTHGSMLVDGELNVDNNVTFGGGSVSLAGKSTFLDFGQAGVDQPREDARSIGTKAVWFSQQGRRAGEVDYATGIDNQTLWNSVPFYDPAYSFKWFAGTKEMMKLDGAGNLTLNGALNGRVVTRGIPASQVADYVFKPDYKLASLSEVEAFAQRHGHLPDVPSAQEVEKNGLDLAEMNMVLLKKVEELTLHAIAQEKELREQKTAFETRLRQLESLVAKERSAPQP